MKLKFTLESSGATGSDTDLQATVDATATVGDLATHLALADPGRAVGGAVDGHELTLSLQGAQRRSLDPRTTIGESGLSSGARLSLTRAGSTFVDAGHTVATVVITAGPDAGAEFSLPRGTAYIGRGRGCEVPLTDPSVSRRHARLVLTDVVEVVDLGSANGLTAGGQQVVRMHLGDDDVIHLGDTSLRVRRSARAASDGEDRGGAGVLGTDSGVVSFSRSPRVVAVVEGRDFEVPELPERPGKPPFPWIQVMIPIVMAVILYWFTKSVLSLLFLAMMPMMVVGTQWEQKRQGRKAYDRAMVDFREDLGLLTASIRAEHERERQGRLGEHPGGTEVLRAADTRSPLLWTRRPGRPGFLQLRLGLGTRPSRSTITMPKVGRSTAEAWLAVAQELQGLGSIDGLPVVADPLADGAVGVCGPRASALGAARSLVLQAAGLHSPAELVVVAFASVGSAHDWDFLKWLPHTSSAHSPLVARTLASTTPACSALADELEDLVQERTDAEADTALPCVLVLVEGDAPVDRARLVGLAERGAPAGVVVLWVAPRQALLPAACSTFLVLPEGDGAGEGPLVGMVHEGQVVAPVEVDVVDAAAAAYVARRLAPVVDAGVAVQDDSDLPRAVSFLALTGTEIASSPQAQVERWVESRSVLTGPHAPETPYRKAGNLRAVVGQTSQGALTIDLRSDGPHALVGGTTGAGKSELLQAWILGMAAAHSPQRVTFLLVDYKGGSAFRDCVDLPHTVGLVTDLSPHLVHRALESLKAELRHRERLLARHKAKDVLELERRGEVEAPPSLVIVVDEFAALATEVPQFVDGVVDVAQRGRSLGLHLILATQRPTGVIKDNLRANTNLRMALRMADEADSDDVLGSTAAAFFAPDLPGRAMVKSGPGRLTPFQTGYAGGWTPDTPPPAELTVTTLAFGGEVEWERPTGLDDLGGGDPGPTDIQRVVATLREAATLAAIPPPRKPWQPELRDVYDLARLPSTRRDTELVFGVADHPQEQSQPLIAFHPDTEGNLAVVGASGSGKSVLLRTLAIAAGLSRGGPCQVYGLDFGNRGLTMLEQLPYVGSIVPGNDHERVVRLLGHLKQVVEERAVRYSKVSAATITDYRRLAGAPDEPRIVVLVDGMTAFRQAYEVSGRMQYLDLLSGLAGDGRPVGVHFVISADQRTGMPGALAAAVQRRVVLRLPSPDDYAVMGVPLDVLTMASPPGRGLFGGEELQVAVLGASADVSVQAAAVAQLAALCRRSGVVQAPRIESLAERVPLESLPTALGGLPVIGTGSETLGPKTFAPRGTFVVVGPSGSGRTTALATMARALDRFHSGADLFLLSARKRSELASLGVWTGCALGAEDVARVAAELTARVTGGGDSAPLAVIIERVDDLTEAPVASALETLAKALLDTDQFVVGEGEAQFFASNFGLPGVLKTSRTGLALHPNGDEGHSVFRADLPGLRRSELPEGRGFLVEKGKHELVQVAI